MGVVVETKLQTTSSMVDGKLQMNHQITCLLQDIFNLILDLTCENFVRSFNVNTKDQMLINVQNFKCRFFHSSRHNTKTTSMKSQLTLKSIAIGVSI